MSELPSGWVEARLGQVTTKIGSGATPTGGEQSYKASGVPLIRSLNVHFDGVRAEGLAFLDEAQAAKLNNVIVEANDVLLNITGASIGRVAVAPSDYQGARVNQHVSIIRLVQEVLPHYVCSFLASPAAQDVITRENYGVTRQALTKSMIEHFAFPLPPLAEQKRIVTKLDALNAKSARARTELARIETLVSRYKQAVLDLLCDVSHSTASLRDLVDPKRGIPYGIVQTGKPVVDGVPTIRCGDIKNYSLSKNELKLVDRQIARQYGRTALIGGEVLIAIRGSIGETCVADNDLVGCNISREVAMIPLLPGTSPQFVMYYLKSNKAKEFIGANTKGSAQQGINLGDLRNLPIPALMLEEQHEIVRRIESAFAKIDRLAKEAKRALELVGRLDEAILAKAFRGELVPQDANDEPAEHLLARIHAEREAAPKARRGRR